MIPVKVESLSGFKADEYPVSFYWLDVKFEISEISDRWYQASTNEQVPVANYFKVRTTGKQEFILKHEIQSDQWFIVRPKDDLFSYLLN